MANGSEVHFGRPGLQPADMLEHSNGQTAGCIHLCHMQWTKKMNKTPWLQQFQAVYGADSAGNGRCSMVGLQQMSIEWMTDLLAYFSGPVNLVDDFCAGTVETANTCLILFDNRGFRGCRKD